MAASKYDPSCPSPEGSTHNPSLERSFRQESGRATATLSRVLGDVHRAEDAVQEAYLIAMKTWARDGVPANTAAWIITTAKNRAIDALRRDARGSERVQVYAQLESAAATIPDLDWNDVGAAIPDDRLALIFACCHPALAEDARVALTLRAVCGLSTDEIARAFLVPVTTMAQRIVRAKKKILEAGITFEIPDPAHRPERIDAVARALYLVFSEGYAATSGASIVRHELCDEAIRLARLLVTLLPGEAELHGLLALMWLTDARRAARTDEQGEIVTLEEQDRTRWNQWMIAAGLAELNRAAALRSEGPYQLQAAIAAIHDRTASFEKTNWNSIVALYDRLFDYERSPVVALNRAAAIAMRDGYAQGLEAMESLGEDLAEYGAFHAARADLLSRIGRDADAQVAYKSALLLTTSEPERRHIERRVLKLAVGHLGIEVIP